MCLGRTINTKLTHIYTGYLYCFIGGQFNMNIEYLTQEICCNSDLVFMVWSWHTVFPQSGGQHQIFPQNVQGSWAQLEWTNT